MRKKLLLLCTFTAILTGYSHAQHFDAALVDQIGTASYPYSSYIIEAENNQYYMFGGAWYDQITNPNLPDISADFINMYFIKYDSDGTPLWGNYITGLEGPVDAFVDKDGNLWILGASYNEVSIEGNPISLNQGSMVEFLVVYDKDGNLLKYKNLWNLGQYEYPYSKAAFDRNNSAIYIYGSNSSSLMLDDGSVLGDSWNGYFYVLKYDLSLNLVWKYETGFSNTGEGGYFYQMNGFTDVAGDLLVSGVFDSYGTPLTLGSESITIDYQNTYGQFISKISTGGTELWHKWGETGNQSAMDDEIHTGIALPGGDMIVKGTTTSGSFKLNEDVVYSFTNGSNLMNQVLFRIRPDGSVVWVTGLATMGMSYQGKKAQVTDERTIRTKEYNFESSVYDQSRLANKNLLITAGTFGATDFTVAGSVLPLPYSAGVYFVGIDPETGNGLWGQSISSSYISFHGFDCDGSGNMSAVFDANPPAAISGFDDIAGYESGAPVIFGIDYTGKPFWYNFLRLEKNQYGLYASDVEVLKNGTVLFPVSYSYQDQIVNYDQLLPVSYPYGNAIIHMYNNSLINGTVKTSGGSAVGKGYVLAYYHSQKGNFPVVDSVLLDASGNFSFAGLLPGQYTLKCVADAGSFPNAKPTYYVSAMKWGEASTLTVEIGSDLSGTDITLQELQPFTAGDGSGSASGNLSYVDESAKKSIMGRPVVKASVVLVGRSAKASDGEVVAIIETDEEGNYIFNNIPDGLYRLEVDIPGLDMISSYDIVIENNTILFGLDFYVDTEDGIYTTTTGIAEHSLTTMKLYPNPGNGHFTVNTDKAGTGIQYISVYASDGRLVLGIEGNGGQEQNCNLADLSTGIYLIKVQTGGGTEVLRYMLR